MNGEERFRGCIHRGNGSNAIRELIDKIYVSMGEVAEAYVQAIHSIIEQATCAMEDTIRQLEAYWDMSKLYCSSFDTDYLEYLHHVYGHKSYRGKAMSAVKLPMEVLMCRKLLLKGHRYRGDVYGGGVIID